MSDNKDKEKKGFFARLFEGATASSENTDSKDTETTSKEIPTISALNKMKKADIVKSAKDLGLELDISLTKVKLVEAWQAHFDPEQSSKKEEAPAEEVVAEAEEEAPVEEEAPAEEVVAEAEEESINVSTTERSSSKIIEDFESKQLRTDHPSFRPGDTVTVSVKVREGNRTRLQAFEGVVMGIRKKGINSSFIVRKISSGIGVERTFQTHSPMIDSISVKRKGDVRQSKLFYLRERSGRSARIKERLE